MSTKRELEEEVLHKLPYESPQVEVVKVKVEEGFMKSGIIIVKDDGDPKIKGDYAEKEEVQLYNEQN